MRTRPTELHTVRPDATVNDDVASSLPSKPVLLWKTPLGALLPATPTVRLPAAATL